MGDTETLLVKVVYGKNSGHSYTYILRVGAKEVKFYCSVFEPICDDN